MLATKETNESRKRFSGALWAFGLVFLFVLSFALPVVFAFHMNSGSGDRESPEGVATEDFNPFEENLIVAGPGSNLKITHNAVLEPEAGKDFVFFIWFRPKSFPELEEQLVFVSKFDAQTKAKSGYAFGVGRDSESVYPVVYWRDVSGEGQLFRFAEMSYMSKVWTLMAVSYQKGKYLGVHAATLSGPGVASEVRLLGGYQTEVVPHSSADLVVGALKSGTFKGRIGAMGVLSGEGVGRQIEEIMTSMLREPKKIPSFLDESFVKFWTVDGISDVSSHQLEISAKGGVLGGGKKGAQATTADKKRTKRDDKS